MRKILYLFVFLLYGCNHRIDAQGVKPILVPPSAGDNTEIAQRQRVVSVARGELGVKELTGRNDHPRIMQYLRVCGIRKPSPWCASWLSFCFYQAQVPAPRDARSGSWNRPQRVIWRSSMWHPPMVPLPGDVFWIPGHVGLVDTWMEGPHFKSIEGNWSNRVRHVFRRKRQTNAILNYIKPQWKS